MAPIMGIWIAIAAVSLAALQQCNGFLSGVTTTTRRLRIRSSAKTKTTLFVTPQQQQQPTLPQKQFVQLLPHPVEMDEMPFMTAAFDRLPTSYVAMWPTFVLDLTAISPAKEPSTSYSWMWSRIPDGEGSAQDSSDDDALQAAVAARYVNPATFDTLWQALDLKAPSMQVAIGLHIRNGQVRHIFPALDLYYTTVNGNEDENEYEKCHRNRGLQTVPRAFQWMDFASYDLASSTSGNNDILGTTLSCRLETASAAAPSSSSSSTTTASFNQDVDSTVWTAVQQLDHTCIRDMVRTALTALATDPPNALGDGSCIVHVVVASAGTLPATTASASSSEQSSPSNNAICPIRTGSQIRVVLDESDHDANDNGSISSPRLARRVVGTLDVTVQGTAIAGSESEYRPECYTALFTDPSLQRPAFVESRRRVAAAAAAASAAARTRATNSEL